jgi:hypothetical protein
MRVIIAGCSRFLNSSGMMRRSKMNPNSSSWYSYPIKTYNYKVTYVGGNVIVEETCWEGAVRRAVEIRHKVAELGSIVEIKLI